MTTDKVDGHKFKWDAYGAAEISKAKMIRFDIRGSSDSYIALSTEPYHSSLKICYLLGGMNNTTCTGGWQMKGDVNNRSWFQAIDDTNNTSIYRG